MKTRSLVLPAGRSMGYLHARSGDYPYTFHGRFKKEGGLLEGISNPGWELLGGAFGQTEVDDDCVLLEVMAEPARDLSPLLRLKPDDLDAIWLGNTWVDDTQLRYLGHLTGLRWLNVENNANVTDAGLAELASLTSLLHLGIRWTRVTDAGLLHLQSLKKLQFLDVRGCNVTAPALAELKARLPKCLIRTE